jgi:site-specific DNA recombinase
MYKVATYARVSTKLESQKTSISNQADFFLRELEKHQDWTLYKNYVDEGISGTSKSKRKEFMQMIEDAQNKKFDILIAKSMTRFGRNRADTSHTLEKVLFPNNIRVIFVEERLDSENKDDRAKMGLFEWLAEVESRKISDRVSWHREQLQEKGLVAGYRPPYGYNIENSKLIVNPEEAKIVKEIYNLFLKGWGLYKVLNWLWENDIQTKFGSKWCKSSVIMVLTNPNYTGDLHQRRTKIKDPISKGIVRYAKEDWVVSKDTHEPIIDKKTFELAQIERLRRKDLAKQGTRHSTSNLFSGLIYCGRCGSLYGLKKIHEMGLQYSCRNYETLGRKGCTREAIEYEKIIEIIQSYAIDIEKNPNILKEAYDRNIKIILNQEEAEKKIVESKKVLEKLKVKQTKLLDSYFGENKMKLTELQFEEYNASIRSQIEKIEIEILNFKKYEIQNKQTAESYTETYNKLLLLKDVKNWTNVILKQMINKIVVNDRNNIEIDLNIMKPKYLDGTVNQCKLYYSGTSSKLDKKKR